MLFKTGIDEVDERIREQSSIISGFPIVMDLAHVRIYHGGSPTTERRILRVTNIRESTVPADFFDVPAGYRNQKPVLGVPGL